MEPVDNWLSDLGLRERAKGGIRSAWCQIAVEV
jgi:hypothetical protein